MTLFSGLWDLCAKGPAKVSLADLPETVASVVTKGDGVHDHYGGRSSFLILEARGSRFLVLSQEGSHSAFVRSVVNATGGYGTGILGNNLSFILPELETALMTSAPTTDEHHCIHRAALTSMIKSLLSAHTQTVESEWQVSFTSTGTEAVDFAQQIIALEGHSLASGIDSRVEKDVVVACHGAWHGWGMGPIQLLDRRQFTDGLPKNELCAKIVFVPFGDNESLQNVFTKYGSRIRAFIAEGILGDGGVVEASTQWWESLRMLCDQYDARMVVDEILTGFRCGSILALPVGVKPDCVLLGKALGAGLFPVSTVAWRRESLTPRPGVGVRTFNARPFHARIINTVLTHIITQGYFEHSRKEGEKLKDLLKNVVAEFPSIYKDVRGRGFLFGVELAPSFARKGKLIRNMLIERGVMTELESGILSSQVAKKHRINPTLRMTLPLSTPLAEFAVIVEAFRQTAQYLMEPQS